ncbi:Nif11-like leader peptide family natural product precursor [Leptolyngbya boryana CZ1]|uniref:Nif11-like leader peptide family natural product n=1 Tax=Leptolyngbya boryana CZ1 TaxID=3060204 RepID=A0AA96WQI8_LEPBY|nr:Nif11-like leader peptide family natural product precursor [Leptolyngbya boryana]WNZ43907.1 Nif11-like leader peptide family natural product precursor [Leptolyngbya boryana CZ1]
MSLEAAYQFIQQVIEDRILQAELVAVLQQEDDREAATQLGNRKGYHFTSDELWVAVQARQGELKRVSEEEGLELSDADLEAIAGGEALFTLDIGLFTLNAQLGSDTEIKW